MADLSSIALGAAFLYAEPRSPTTRAVSIAFIANGLGDPFWVYTNDGSIVTWRLDLVGFLVAASGAAFAEWLLRVARTAQATKSARVWITGCLRLAQVLTGLLIVLTLTIPDGVYYFLTAPGLENLLNHPRALLVAVPTAIYIATFAAAGALTVAQRIDAAERIRVFAMAAAMPFLAGFLALPIEAGALCNLAGQLVFLVGAIRYHAMQGQRGQFLARFLSPQVSEQVRAQGLLSALQQAQLEITVVCCDLRGFTAYSQVHPSKAVAEVLHDYYTAVSDVVSRFGGTIKDFAGDGILILIGAPIAMLDHAQCGLELAKAARTAAMQSIGKWSKPDTPLGVGFGVASGKVTVGVIEAASRLEYMAIGPAVNLAARMCATAKNGEIRVAECTAELAGKVGLNVCEPVTLKGFGEAVPHFAVP